MPVPYANAADFALMVDATALAQLGSDSSSDGDVNDSNEILVAALTRASYDVQSYAMRGGNYTLADLDSMQTEENGTLTGLVCDLALIRLIVRKVRDLPESIKDLAARTNQTLIDLRDGKLVFGGTVGGADRADSGLPSLSIVDSTARGHLRMVSDEPFFPTRQVQAW